MSPAPKIRENRGNAGKGRPPGALNKTTTEIKTAVIEAFQKAGGVDYLVKLAEQDPRTFCALVGKVIPLQVDANVNAVTMTKEQRDAAIAAYARSNS